MSSPGTPGSRRSRRRSRVTPDNSELVPASPNSEAADNLATPLPVSSPVNSGAHNDRDHGASNGVSRNPMSVGPGSVLVSEVDLSSPLNYGTPSSSLGVGATPSSRTRGTPIRARQDVQSERRLRQVALEAGSEPNTPSRRSNRLRSNDNVSSESAAPSNAGPQLVIWGTDVSIQVCKHKFKRFLLTFVVPEVEQDELMEGFSREEPLYLQKLEEVNFRLTPYLNINCGHLKSFDEDLYRQLVCYPQEVIPTFDMAVNEVFFEKYPNTVLDHQIQVRPFNADKTKNMRSLNPEDIDQLLTITGMVIRASNLMPEMVEAFFRCSVCHQTVTVEVERGRIAEPTLCTNCNTNHSFSIIHNRSHFSDKQMVKLQESPDDMPAGQTPHTVVLFTHGNLVDAVQPGDRVAVTGIYRALPVRANPRQRNVKSVYKTHLDVVHFRKIDNKRLYDSSGAGDDEVQDNQTISPERVAIIKALAQKEDVYERLARAVAPSIYENEDIKKGILLQLFGGSKKDLSQTGRGQFRSELNILLCGDPGTSKSQLLQYIYNLVPRSQYVSGKGSSAVGLTAYVTRDTETRQLVLQTGALVLADNGICCIDEFDKMSDTTRAILHEVMEQQTLSIAKAGIICQLNARTSILAAANPIESQWNPKKTIVENIQLPHTLMSRFDLIFLMLDPQDELFDRRLGRHLVSLYYRSNEDREEEALNSEVLRDYILYAKRNVNPLLSDEAGNLLIESYIRMRQVGRGRGQITAFPRQLESLIRLAEAHARMRLSPTVELRDVEEATRLYKEALKQSAVDPISGKIDVSILTTGQGEGQRMRRAKIKDALKTVIEKKGSVQTVNYANTWNDLKAQSDLMITRDMYEDALKDLSDDGLITLTGRTTIRVNHGH